MEKNDDVEETGAGGPFPGQNASNGDAFLPAPGGGKDGGGESDCELTLDMLSWTSDEGEILEMWDAVSTAGGGDDGGGGGGELLGKGEELPSKKEIEAKGRCGGGSAAVDGGVEYGSDAGSGGTEDGSRGGGEEKVMRKGPWTVAEDALLMKVVEELGSGDWVAIERYSGLARTSKSCRLRWTNHLRPNLKKGSFSPEEERSVVRMHYKYGNKWSRMARHMPGRTDNEIKNFWHSRVKKCKKQGLPIYPGWCLEEEKTSNNGENYDVDDKPNHISVQADNSCAAPPLVERRLSFPQQPPPTYQTTQIPISESHSSQAQVSLSGQQPNISAHEISQDQLSSAFHSTQTSLSAADPSPEMQYDPSQGQYFASGPHYLSSSEELKPLQDLPTTCSSALRPLSPGKKNCGSSAQQPCSKYHSNLSVNNSSFVAFKPSRPPPILSPPSGRFKRLHVPTSQLPPVPKPTQLSFPEHGHSVSASAASVSSFHLNAMNPAPHSSLASKLPTTESAIPSIQLNKSTLNSSITPSKGSSLKRYLPTSEVPVSSWLLNSSIRPGYSSTVMSEPPSIQHPRGDLKENPEMKQSTTKSRSYSDILDPFLLQEAQTKSRSYSDLLDPFLLQEAQTKSRSYSDLLDPSLLQEAQAEPSLSDLQLVKGYLLSKRLKMQQLYGNILERKISQNITSNKGVSLAANPCIKGLSNRSLSEVMMRKMPDTQDLAGNYSYRNFPLNGSSNTINFSSGMPINDCLSNFGSYGKDLLGRSGGITVSGDSARKQELLRKITKKGLPSEVSDTEVLLVEKTRKENLLREVSKIEDSLGLSSQGEISYREGLVHPEDLTSTEIMDIEKSHSEKLLRESSKRKLPMTESLEKEYSTSTSSKIDQHSRGENLTEGFSNPREPASVPGEGSKKLCIRDEILMADSFPECSEKEGQFSIHGQEYVFDALCPLFSQSTTITPLRASDSLEVLNYFQSYQGDFLPQSLQKEWSKNLKTENLDDQTFMDQYLGETLKEEGLPESQDQLRGICESSFLPCQYAAPGLIKSGHIGVALNLSKISISGSLDRCVVEEDSCCKSLGKGNTCDNNLGNELLKESSTEQQALVSSELKPSQNGPDPVISQSTTDDMSKLQAQSGKSGSGNCCSGDFGGLMRQNSEGERQLASQQLKPLHNGQEPVICQSTKTHVFEYYVQNGESGSFHCSEGKEVPQKAEENVDTLPEELSSLLEFSPPVLMNSLASNCWNKMTCLVDPSIQ